MRLLIAPDKFKGTFTAARVCSLLAQGVREARPGWEIDAQPMADGGEGTLDALLSAFGGTRVPARARGPLGDAVEAAWGVAPDGTALFESALFAGLDLVPEKRRDPRKASSFGLGEGIAAALDAGARRFLIGLGGVATVDGGAGMARALGFRFEDSHGAALDGSPESLSAIHRVDPSMAHPALAASRFTLLCDVSHPLTGPQGAAAVFGPQKGAGPADVLLLEGALGRLGGAMAPLAGLDPAALAAMPMGGAAGGLAAGGVCFLRGELKPGAIFLAGRLLSRVRLEAAGVVVTGEGSLDHQTAGGKTVAAVLGAAREASRPAIVVTGRWDGTLPSTAPGGTVVLAGAPGGGSRLLGAEDLVALGRLAAEEASCLAKAGEGC